MINSSRNVIAANELIEPGPRDWFISDHHFWHANIIKHAQRPFSNVAVMNEAMIAQWNSLVGATDRVIHLVPGNHDPAQALLDAQVVDTLLPPICEVPYRCKRTGHKRYFVLCHYPMAEWHRMWGGAIHLHGHTHGNDPGGHPAPPGLRRLYVSADAVGYTPLTPQGIIDRFPV